MATSVQQCMQTAIAATTEEDFVQTSVAEAKGEDLADSHTSNIATIAK